MFAVRRNGMWVWPQAVAFGSNGMRLAAIHAGDIYPRGMTGFVTFKQQPFGVGKELPGKWDHIAGGERSLLPHACRQKYEVRRRHVLPQNQSPLTVWRKRVGRTLAQAHGGSPGRVAG